MVSPDGRFVLTFNGEIYNYVELREELSRSGVEFTTASDTEVLLQQLIHRGARGIRDLNGMFAFAFVDKLTGEWILARDHFGVKPLYYASVGDELVFGSEIKALLVHQALDAFPNWPGLQEYLTFQFCLGKETLFEGVYRVEPGTCLIGVGGKIEKTRVYWDTDFTIDEDHTEQYFVNRLRALVHDSVRLQVRSDVPLGAHLSGGLDSSVITSLAAEHLPGRMMAFHGRFNEGPQFDESGFARQAAGDCGAELHVVTPTAQQFVDEMPGLIWSLDEPVAGPGVFPQYLVSKLAAQHVKVCLGGQGGDEIFGGYARYLIAYLEQALKGAIFGNQDEGKHVVTLRSIVNNLSVLREYGPLMQHFFADGLFDAMDARYFRLVNRSPNFRQLLTADALAAIDQEHVFARFQDVFHRSATRSYINKMTGFDQRTLLPALLQIEDRVSMAVSLESRVPFLDWRIVELVSSLPPKVKFRGGETKYILRKAVAGTVPDAVLNRTDKMGFPVPLRQWLRRGPVREFVHDTLRSQAAKSRGLFDPQALESLIHAENASERQLWGVLCLELWYQTFIDKRTILRAAA